MRTESAVSVVVCENYVLLLRRVTRSNDPWSGDICFPGGFVKEGESPLQTALRELREETGIKPSNVKFRFEHDIFHPVRFPSVNVHPFVFTSNLLYDIEPDGEIESGSWHKIGTEILLRDESRGEYISWNGDVVWGLTFRIYNSLKDRFIDMAKSK
ncbi:MAG: NUDIX hydrolase [Cuniculiplasma sp.]